MALDFPSGATTGTIYTGTNNVTYEFDGVKWIGQTSAVGSVDLTNVNTDIVPDGDNTRSLGGPANQWKDVFVSTGSIYIGNIKLSNVDGKLATTTVINPGEENEEPDPEDSDASSEIRTVSELVNGEHVFRLEDDGSLTLDGDPSFGGGGSTGDITFDGVTLRSDNGTGPWYNGIITLAPGSLNQSDYADYGQYVNIYPTWAFDQPHIHIAAGTGTNGTGSLILGDDNYHIDINNDGNIYIKTNNQTKSWEFDAAGAITFPDGTVQTTAYVTPQQYGYINQFVHSSNDNVDMEAVAMDADGNSYVSYSYYDDNEGIMRGGIIKLDSTGNVQWNNTLQSSNVDGEYPHIASLEYVDIQGTGLLVSIGYYYDNVQNKDRGFLWFVNPTDGSVGSEFDVETTGDIPVSLNDGVFGLDGTGNPFAVLVGHTYNEILTKTFTPLAGSGLNKLVVSWSEFNASGVQPGETVYYNVGGSYNIRLNAFDVVANIDGNPANGGVNIQVSINENGTYNIIQTNGWSGVIYGWTDPVNVIVLGSYLGGADGVNDLTFDFSPGALNANSDNVAGWSSNIQGTAISDVVGFGYGDKDWSTELGNSLEFEYQLNRQAYIARLGNNSWSQSVGDADYEELHTVVVDSNGNSYVGGYYWNGSKASLVIKFDIDGNQQWAVYIDPANNTGNAVMSIDLLSDGDIIVVDEEGYVTKLDSSDGSIIWQVRVDPNDDISWDSDFKGTATPDGNYIFANYEDDDYKMYVMCVSGVDGSEVWSKRITRTFGGSNGEIFPQDDFPAQYIDCNATSVTIAASTYLYFNGNSTDAGLIINFPVNGENTDGVYDQYIIETVDPGWNTESTTSTVATISSQASPVTTTGGGPTTSTISFTVTENIIGEAAAGTGDIAFDGSKLSSPATFSGDFPNGVITLAPGNTSDSNYADNGQFINIYPTNNYDAPHIHIAPGSGNNSTGDLILGVDDYHIDVNHNGSIYVKTNNQSYSWEFDTNGNLILPSGGDIRDSGGSSVLGSSLPRGSVGNTSDPDLSVGNIRVMMTSGVITVRHASGSSLALLYSGRTVSASGTTSVLATGGVSVNTGEAHTLATLTNKGDTMVLDYIYDANTSEVYRVTVFVSWSSIPYGSIVIEQIA